MPPLNLKSVIRPKFDYSDVDINTIDPDKLSLGTNTQDCALIASFYERSAHVTPSESAVFATLTRSIQNNKKFAVEAAKSMDSYLQAPQQDASRALSQAQKFATVLPEAQGVSGQTEHSMQSLDVGTQKGVSLNAEDVGGALLDWARDCIPCNLRIQSFLELHPNVDLLGALEAHIKNALGVVSDITSLLNNFDIYGSMCDLLDLLSFMCIPDLQRIIATLMALFMLQAPSLDGLIGMLQAIIAPLFAPLLLAITALLDQFGLLVTNPLQCIIDAINAQLEKLNVEVPKPQAKVTAGLTSEVNKAAGQLEKVAKGLGSGLEQLSSQMQEAVKTIQEKLNFYIDQVKAMLGELGGGDAAYLQLKLKVLQIIRMISFVTAIIAAITQGHLACQADRSPALSEVDNFFNTYLNPNSAFNLSIVDGEILVTEGGAKVFDPLYEPENVLKFEGNSLLPEIYQAADDIVQPIKVGIPCKLELSVEDTSKVNQWMRELSK